jgi:hypothetical protein
VRLRLIHKWRNSSCGVLVSLSVDLTAVADNTFSLVDSKKRQTGLKANPAVSTSLNWNEIA